MSFITLSVISIHPMLRFNFSSQDFHQRPSSISIHPMLRFNPLRFLKVRFKDFKFQYILCYGSTGYNRNVKYLALSISIHPMLRFNISSIPRTRLRAHFNTSYVTVQLYTCTWIIWIKPFQYFNTSYVTVQPHWCYVIYIFHHT